ncbi:LamG-like jellyroll fold domain-containing protein [Modestobacter sp. SYSU DS0875]
MTQHTRRPSLAARALTLLARTTLGVLVLLLLASVLPVVAGWQSTVVMSGSMSPAVEAGDVAVVRPVDIPELTPGQVLLVDDPDSPGQLRLHRLVAVESGGLRLRGDANPQPDGTLVDPAAVHGVGTLRLPSLGLPVLWAAEGRWLPLGATALGLAGLLAVARLHRSAGAQPRPPGAGGAGRGGRRPLRSRRGRAAAAAAGAALLVAAWPGTAGAVFTASTANHANAFTAARYFSCAGAGAAAPGYFPLQETSGSVAYNSGTAGSVANGRYAGTVYSSSSGPAGCGANGTRAIQLDGRGQMYTSYPITNPQTFTVQLWFRTTTGQGGKLVGFGNGTNGDQSSAYDRHVYMTNTGRLVFGVYNGTIATVTSPRPYNDGAWHLMTATLSPGNGMRLYVDGELVGARTGVSAENFTGYWRIGFDNINTWPDAPTSYWFTGSLAHASFHLSEMSANEVAAQYAAGS